MPSNDMIDMIPAFRLAIEAVTTLKPPFTFSCISTITGQYLQYLSNLRIPVSISIIVSHTRQSHA